MKVMINGCYGGFALSDEAILRFSQKHPEVGDEEISDFKLGFSYPHVRTNPDMVSIVEELGEKANRYRASCIQIVDIPDEATDWTITDYDGVEDVIYVLDGKLHYA